MQLGARPRTSFPDTYLGFQLVRAHGCHFAVPPHLSPEKLYRQHRLGVHPAVLKSSTWEGLRDLIDRSAGNSHPQAELAERCGDYQLIRRGDAAYAVPECAGPLDLDLEEDLSRAGAFRGETIEELRERARALEAAVAVEFAGWLPIYESMGNCGRHPQFAHITTPPPGYKFLRSAPPPAAPRAARSGPIAWCYRKLRALVRGIGGTLQPVTALFRYRGTTRLRWRLRLLASVVRLFFTLWRGGGRLSYVVRFIRSRNFPSQLLVAAPRDLVFLTSAPYTFNQSPWVIEIEDPTTLFFPFIQNGHTNDLDLAESPYFPIVKALLESGPCRGILTHIRSTARLVPTLFGSETIARKVHYVPLGVKAPGRWQRHEEAQPEQINLLFINSWSQHPGNLQCRGGLDILEAFSILRERYPQLRLTLRTNLMVLDDYYHHIIESGWVRVINRFLSVEELEALHAESHIFVLPAARIHVVSLLNAMASGLAVVTSDGWGIEEYVTHERNGLIVPGRYGKTSWADEQAGMVREDYEPTYTVDPEIVRGAVESVSRLVEDHELRRRLGRQARHDVVTCYNLENWNRGLQQALDKAIGQA